MDTSDPEIHFDAEGHCSHCTDALARLKKFYLPDIRGEQRLAALIAEIKAAGQGKAYDCASSVCPVARTVPTWLINPESGSCDPCAYMWIVAGTLDNQKKRPKLGGLSRL